jgi:ankyrin repeat protein
VLERLLAAGADKEARTNKESTPLHIAAQNGHEQVLERLLAAGADKEARTNTDYTPLHLAAEKGHEQVVERLLAAGADKEARANKESIIFYAKITYDNPILNHLELLKTTFSKYGGKVVNQVIELCSDDEIAEEIISSAEEYGIEHVLSIIFGDLEASGAKEEKIHTQPATEGSDKEEATITISQLIGTDNITEDGMFCS